MSVENKMVVDSYWPEYNPEEVYSCDYCKQPIFEGETYISFEGNHYHNDCFDEVCKGYKSSHAFMAQLGYE